MNAGNGASSLNSAVSQTGASAGIADFAGRPSADRPARPAASAGTAALVLRETVSVTAPANSLSRNPAAFLREQPVVAYCPKMGAALREQPVVAHCPKMGAALHEQPAAAHGPKTAAVQLCGKRAANRSRMHRSCCVQAVRFHLY